MITPTEIVQHLQTYLPICTDRFTETLTVTSASVGASNVITVNSTAHGKSAGDNIVVTGGTVQNMLTGTPSLSDSEVTFTTTSDHDQTMPSQANDTWELTLAGFVAPDTAWNDDHTILGVPNRRTIIVAGASAPTLIGAEYLKEKLATGVYTIATASTNSFTIDLSAVPPLPVGTINDMTVISGFRIYAASDFKRAQAIYTNPATSDDACIFVIMTDGDVAKDRHTMNDGQAGFTPQDLHLIRIFRNFSTVVFLPTGADLSGVAAQNLAYDTIYRALIATLFGFTDVSQVIKYSSVPTGDGPAEYNTAYYAHVYDWQLPTTITFRDGFIDLDDVAFRDIAATFQLFSDTEAEMSVNINLDEEEL